MKFLNTWENLGQCWEYIAQIYSPKWTYNIECFVNRISFILIADDDYTVLGFVTLFISPNPTEKYISLSVIEVHPEYRNLGLSKILVNKALEFINDVASDLPLKNTAFTEMGWLSVRKYLKAQKTVKYVESAEYYPTVIFEPWDNLTWEMLTTKQEERNKMVNFLIS